MRWDDQIYTGTHGKWSWIVVREEIHELSTLIKEYHLGQRLCFAAFDSAPITSNLGAQANRWTRINGVMVSPLISPHLDIPCDTHDGWEWYVFPSIPPSIDIMDRYLGYCGFTLADPHALAASQDPTWDRTNYDWLIPLQGQFWASMDRLDPLSYVLSGENNIVVTRDPAFVNRVLTVAREIVGE